MQQKHIDQLDAIIDRNTLGGGLCGRDSSDLGKIALILRYCITGKEDEGEMAAEAEIAKQAEAAKTAQAVLGVPSAPVGLSDADLAKLALMIAAVKAAPAPVVPAPVVPAPVSPVFGGN